MPREKSEIWNARFTAAKLFYLLARYGTIAYFCFVRVEDASQTQSIMVRSFDLLSMDSDTSSGHEPSAWSIALRSLYFSFKFLFGITLVVQEAADINVNVIGQQAYTT